MVNCSCGALKVMLLLRCTFWDGDGDCRCNRSLASKSFSISSPPPPTAITPKPYLPSYLLIPVSPSRDERRGPFTASNGAGGQRGPANHRIPLLPLSLFGLCPSLPLIKAGAKRGKRRGFPPATVPALNRIFRSPKGRNYDEKYLFFLAFLCGF